MNALSAFVNLEELKLRLDPLRFSPQLTKTDFHLALSKCKFPRLKKLVLLHSSMTASEFVDFIQHCSKLQLLILKNCYLRSRTWKPMFDAVKALGMSVSSEEAVMIGYDRRHMSLDSILKTIKTYDEADSFEISEALLTVI